MAISTKEKQQLKGKAHRLKPVVLIGTAGITENVNIEIDRALNDHELIKIRIPAEDKTARLQMLNDIAKNHHAEAIQLIGNIGVLYRKNKE